MKDTTWLTMVALREGVLPPVENVLDNASRWFPQLVDLAEVSQVSTRGNIATCNWGEAVVGVTLVERPLGASLLDGPCANAWYWPEAASAVSGHTAHLLISLLDETHGAVDAALRLTALTSALAHASCALAVLWAPAGLIHEPQAFAEQARQSSRASLPLYLWIDFRVRRHEDGPSQPSSVGRIGNPSYCDVFTTGLERFGKREIEIEATDAPPQKVLEWAYNFAHFVLDRTAVIKDGDTVGLPDGTQFTVAHAKSRVDGTTDVLLLHQVEDEGEQRR